MHRRIAPLVLLASIACASQPTTIDLGNPGRGATHDAGTHAAVDGSSDSSTPPATGPDSSSSDDASAGDATIAADGSPNVADATVPDASAAPDDATAPDVATGDDGSSQDSSSAPVIDGAGSDDGMAAFCATKICIDPIFDCILQGCGAAVCRNLYCIIPAD